MHQRYTPTGKVVVVVCYCMTALFGFFLLLLMPRYEHQWNSDGMGLVMMLPTFCLWLLLLMSRNILQRNVDQIGGSLPIVVLGMFWVPSLMPRNMNQRNAAGRRIPTTTTMMMSFLLMPLVAIVVVVVVVFLGLVLCSCTVVVIVVIMVDIMVGLSFSNLTANLISSHSFFAGVVSFTYKYRHE